MRRVFVGLVLLVVVVAGLPAVVSAGGEVIEHPPIDCYAGNGFNSAFVGDVDWGFPCVAYDGESPVAETSVTKLYPLWDGSRKLVAKFYGDDPGLSSGDACRLPDGTVTTDTWVHRWFWKTTVVCWAPPVPECSTTLPTGQLYAYAWTDVNSNHTFDDGTDVWIAAIVENGNTELSEGDMLYTNCYPLDFDATGFGTFQSREHVITGLYSYSGGQLSGQVGTYNFGFQSLADYVNDDYQESASGGGGPVVNIQDSESSADEIDAASTSFSQAATATYVVRSGNGVNDYFIDVFIEECLPALVC